MNTLETPRSSSFVLEFVRDHPIATRAALGLFAADLAIQLASTVPQATKNVFFGNPERTYIEDYIGSGKCLDKTPYDTSEGATFAETKVKGVAILDVIPAAANSYNPAVLSFTTDNGKIHFADHQTGSFIVDAGCIDAKSGS